MKIRNVLIALSLVFVTANFDTLATCCGNKCSSRRPSKKIVQKKSESTCKTCGESCKCGDNCQCGDKCNCK